MQGIWFDKIELSEIWNQIFIKALKTISSNSAAENGQHHPKNMIHLVTM